MKPSCSQSYHDALAASPRRRWLAETVGLPHFGGRRVIDEDEYGGRLEYANCARCDQTLTKVGAEAGAAQAAAEMGPAAVRAALITRSRSIAA